MKKLLFFALVLTNFSFSQTLNYQRNWATYLGDERFWFKDSKADKAGNIYIVGSVYSISGVAPNFTTAGCYQSTFAGGDLDGFIIKMNNQGAIVWATYFGGEGVDSISAITFDNNNNICIAGSTNSITGITSANSYQTNNNGEFDFMFAKFSSSGSLLWSTYYGSTLDDGELTGNVYGANGGNNFIHIKCDNINNIYIIGHSNNEDLGTTGVFQQQNNGAYYLLTKFSSDGQRIWTTYYGIYSNYLNSLSVSNSGIFLGGRTGAECNPNVNLYNTYYGTAGSYQPLPASCLETYISKFDFNGQRLWSTYYGTNSADNRYSNSLETYQNKIYSTGWYNLSNLSTSGVFQENTINSMLLAQFNENGTRDWASYNGFAPLQNTYFSDISNLSVNNQGVVFLSGVTNKTENIATANGFKTNLTGDYDGFVSVFNNTGQKLWGTYYGGTLTDDYLMCSPSENNFFIVGFTNSTQDIASANGLQPQYTIYAPNDFNYPKSNMFVAYFEEVPLATTNFNSSSFSIYPNPNNGTFTISINKDNFETVALEVYDVLGKKILNQDLIAKETSIKTDNLSKGVYFAKITTSDNEVFTKKIVVE
ncbi:T9SS type A sorting domain-containing protein [Flavobacterium sp.]|uniref:T9SS type A sorting domain-containing protein n=1 Tax=Flavobacterium sp. TaxID=239 RepID=UPI003752D0AB